MYEWAILTPIHQVAFQLSLPKKYVSGLYKLCRKQAAWMVEAKTTGIIGGAMETVEIDECQIGRRKHHRGRPPNEVWVFGAVARGSNQTKCCIEIVKKRDELTLTEVAVRRIHHDSDIVSDGWRAYGNFKEHFRSHKVVNHSTNFVCPTDSNVHTQNVENIWKCLRKFLTFNGAYRRKHLSDYLQEFIYRKSFPDAFETFISSLEAKLSIS